MTPRDDLVSKLLFAAENTEGCLYSQRKMLKEAASAFEAKDAGIARLTKMLSLVRDDAMRLDHALCSRESELEIAESRITSLERQLAEAMEVLEFYASPFEYVQNHRLDEQTPDFYDELNTGERAQNFLAAAAIRGGAK